MDWIAISVTIGGDPAVHRMAAVLRIRVAEVVGLLGLTFAGMAQHAPSGQLADVPNTLLEQWSTWHGKRGAFAAQFRAELCDDAGQVRAWEKYNGANIRRLESARERARIWRETQERERAECEQNANGTHTRTRTKRAAYASTEQNSTEQKIKSASAAGADRPEKAGVNGTAAAPAGELPAGAKPDPFPKAVNDAVYEAWLATLGSVDYGRLRKALLPLYKSATTPHPTAEQLVQAVAAFLDARDADDPKWRSKYTPEMFASQLHDYVRMGGQPYLDEWGEATERGRMARILA